MIGSYAKNQFPPTIGHDRARLLDAQHVAPLFRRHGDEGRARLFGSDREARIVVGNEGLGEEAVGPFDRRDAGQCQLLGEPVLQGAEGALGAPARLRRIGRDVLDAELGQGPSELGGLVAVHLATRLGGVEVVARAVGVERARQPVPAEHLAQPLEARHGALLGDQEARVDRPARIVQRDDHILLFVAARQPAVRRAVLMQHHAHERPPRPLAPVRPAPGRRRRQAAAVEKRLGPGVTPAEAVVLHQVLVEVLDRETRVALAVKSFDPHRLVHRHPLGRRLAQTPVQKPRIALTLETTAPAPKRALADPKHLRRLQLAQRSRLTTTENIPKPHHAHTLQNICPSHPTPFKQEAQ